MQVVVPITLGALSIATEAMAGTDQPATDEIQGLKNQLDQLQHQLNALQSKRSSDKIMVAQATPASSPASPAAPAASTNTALHAGPIALTFGGFTELATIYRDHNEVADVGSNFNGSIPFPNSPNEHMSELRFSARQSRLSILAQGPQDGDRSAEAYYEMDFLGAAPTANSNESNSYNMRMRHIYGVYSNKADDFYFLAGQNWSLATLYKKGLNLRQEQIPLTIDAQYAVGFNWTRNPQLRFVKDFNNKFAFGVSLESPQALVFNGPNAPIASPVIFNNAGGSLFSSTNNYTTDVAPDVIGKMAFDPGYGDYELYGMGRWFRDRAAGENDTVTGYGIGGGMILPISKIVDIQVSGLFGNGIGRYGSAQLPDVTIKPDGHFATISEYDILVGLNYRPTPTWTLYAYVGTEHADNKAYSAVVGANTFGYGYGSPLYDNTGCLIESAASKCAANTSAVQQANIGGWWKYYQGPLGNLQFGFHASYTKREIFAGLGGDPDTNIKMLFLSFRYYPYQR
ncbi:MAG TPA: hypothetical protein VET48_08170 [Steroidobacteraceae bacterium]|nr:hypothetical protein [Steroidobacteraceae bacterium]